MKRRSRKLLQQWPIAITVCCVVSVALVAFIVCSHDGGSKKTSETPTVLKRQTRQVVENPIIGNMKKVKLFCWILTQPKNHDTKAIAVKRTWAKRCDKYMFYSSRKNDTLPATRIKIPEGREHLVEKYNEAFKHSFQNYFNDYNWFLKADDDTYVIVENLRLLVSRYDTDTPLVLGYKFKANVSEGYMSGGGGIVFSKEAYRKLVTDGINGKMCKAETKSADVETGRCLNKLGVQQAISLDRDGKETFHPLPPEFHLQGQFPEWMKRTPFNPARKGSDCCSDLSVSFHYIQPGTMYAMDYMLYKMSVTGRKLNKNMLSLYGEPRTYPIAERRDKIAKKVDII